MTVAVTTDPPQFVRVTLGAERTVKGSTNAAILKEEEKLNKKLKERAQRRAEELSQLVREAHEQMLEDVEPYPYQ